MGQKYVFFQAQMLHFLQLIFEMEAKNIEFSFFES